MANNDPRDPRKLNVQPLIDQILAKKISINDNFLLPKKGNKMFRWLFKRCMDCGSKLTSTYKRGDVCDECYDDFDGLTVEEMLE
jgi:protein-arginine kinase activator protein McsA